MAHFTFADGKILFCHLSDMNFADGQDCKFSVCRRQMKRLPSASVSLADGKFRTG